MCLIVNFYCDNGAAVAKAGLGVPSAYFTEVRLVHVVCGPQIQAAVYVLVVW